MKLAPLLIAFAVTPVVAGCGGGGQDAMSEEQANPKAAATTYGDGGCARPKVPSCESVIRAGNEKVANAEDAAKTRTNTFYNTCTVELWSGTRTLTVKSAALNNDHDDWTPYPSPDWERGPAVHYGSTSGFARGCSNTVSFSDGSGTIEIYASDPYHGSNGYYCKATGNYTCAGPLNDGQYDKSNLEGDDLRVLYLACLSSQGRWCWGPFTCAESGTSYC